MAEIRLSFAAINDIRDILAKSREDFGPEATQRYERLIVTALQDLAADSRRAGATLRPDIAPDVLSYHLRYSRERARIESGIVRRPRHLILFRQIRSDLIGIGRVLHDTMELSRHLPPDFGDV
ncbi:type II toxin-antitoxin system RelE/ParE family toxin [Rhizobium sp. CSW-27]|uniref:type II toxin-antitoxin system RelE/ParE family toxin n=1 Tax=Rhizobium sp. CSW-27 TaxID=2839985 RepID=UPI001C0399D6|nr:type II toxin-antitoxin system RelE/ParE family toxin [Rhizobium sp. CSW-27]MBT9369194.1 type II toxin-antitoxin system RelE/ParE family toxin [Rhizobium sp. CSW-27]